MSSSTFKMQCYMLMFFCLIHACWTRIHKLEMHNDARKYIALSTFGFYKRGTLDVQLQDFRATPDNKDYLFGFSLDKTLNDAMNPYLDSHQDTCLLTKALHKEHNAEEIHFILDLDTLMLKVRCSPDLKMVHLYKDLREIPLPVKRDSVAGIGNGFLQRRKRNALSAGSQHVQENPCDQLRLPITVAEKHDDNGVKYHLYNTSFVMYVASDQEEGLYNLYFHNCPNYLPGQEVSLDFKMQITEVNVGNFLSAGEMPLPALYCTMSILFALSGAFWVFLLCQSRHPVFKIHYLMAALVFLKSLSLAFHGINYHYIELLGTHLATWAVLYYVAHLLKGALLFVTLVLVGTGWTFIKHVLSTRDKRLFMAIIPLQVLANVAEIILAESEESAREHRAWRNLFTLVDLLCCGCISFPVVWSIRHLQQASATDGKAASNLRKLKLFHHFYVMIVCYIYFTRIIVYLLRITVPFQYGWLDEMFREMATYVFFVLTGYKFRPAAHNPYYSLPMDDDSKVLTESGLTEGLTRLNSRLKPSALPEDGGGGSLMSELTQQESEALLDQGEGSHDYD